MGLAVLLQTTDHRGRLKTVENDDVQHRIDELAREAGQLLEKHRIMLATAESCTGGWISQALTEVAGSSAWFERGFVTYSNAAKEDMLGVASDTLAQCGAVSEETALAMARGAVDRSRAHMSVAVTGIAGPTGGTEEKPAGTVWIAWGQKLGYAEAQHFLFRGGRRQVRTQSVIAALEGVIKRLGAS